MQLREKQKVKFIYGVLEKQFHHYYEHALRMDGVTGENLMTILETRLDNVVFRLGFARTRKEARQTVRHGHFTVNGKRVDIPSYRVKAGDVVAVGEKFRDLLPIKEALISSERFESLAGSRSTSRSFPATSSRCLLVTRSAATSTSSSSSSFTRSNRCALRWRYYMSEFIRPQVHVEEISETAARVSVEPLERGYGDTLGNSLRRALLSSLEGAAVEAIQIDGAQHEFTTIPNMVEDVTDIVLNVKGLVFRTLGTTDEGTATISVDGPCEVTGADFFIPSEFELVNPEQHIATLTEGGHLTMSMRIGYGRGYVSYEQNKRDNDPIGIINVDSLFSPVKRCAKLVEACRVGQHTDYDRLVLEIETNGALSPRDAVVSAANIINQHMAAFMTLADEPEAEEEIPSSPPR